VKNNIKTKNVARSRFYYFFVIWIIIAFLPGCPRSPKGRIGLWWQLNPNPSVAGTASGGRFDVLDVQVVDSNCIVAVGTQGMFLRTTNFGNTWLPAKTLPHSTIRAVFFLNRDTGYAAGDPHKIYRTTNGGITWENTLEFPTNPAHEPGGTMWHFRDIYFADENNGVAVGHGPDISGIVFWTNDGAQTWSWNYAGNELYAIDFANDNLGIAVGGTKHFSHSGAGISGIRTTDGITGEPNIREIGSPQNVGWEEIDTNIRNSLGGTKGSFTDISFVDDTTAYVAGYIESHGYGVFGTMDAGESWFPIITDKLFSHLSYTNPDEGTAVGGFGLIMRNSGSSSDWEIQPSWTDVPLTCVDFISPNRGAIGGYGNTILTTRNGGNSWQGPRSVTVQDLLGIEALGDNFVAVCGYGGTIAVSQDSGETWCPQCTGNNYPMFDIAYANPTSGIAVGLHGYVVYSDDGQSWNVPDSYPFGTGPTGEELNMNGVDFFTDTRAVAAGKNRLAVTEDGGRNWTEYSIPENTHLLDVACLDSNHAVAVGKSGVILRTEDGGQTWITAQSPVTDHLYGVYFQDSQYGWAVGFGPGGSHDLNPALSEKGTILHTQDGGLTWTEQTSGTETALTDIHFTDQNTGIAVGGQGGSWYQSGPPIRGIILVTSDGGNNWKISDLPRHENIQGVKTLPGGRVYIAGSRGFIARTANLSNLY